MRLELELQYAEFHPDQVEKVGLVDYDQAIKVIHSYPWDREFAKIEERTKEDLTSTVPNLAIKNKEKEILIVSARDKDNFIIELLTPTHRGELIIPINSFNNKQGLSIEEIVAKFYEGTIKSTLRLTTLTPIETTGTKVYKLRDHPIFISGLTVGVLTLILIFDFWTNGLTSKALPAIYFVGLVILLMGFSSIVTIQYLLNDWGKEVSFGQDGITIKQRGNEFRIKRGDIAQIAVIENANHRSLRYYKYARIKTKDDKAFIVTSFIMEPIDLVNKLKVNHKEESVFLPTIRLDIQSDKEKEKITRDRERKKTEFLENFKDYEDAKLRQIIRDKKSYADCAIEAATEILEKRK
jgi:hypothetical protein